MNETMILVGVVLVAAIGFVIYPWISGEKKKKDPSSVEGLNSDHSAAKAVAAAKRFARSHSFGFIKNPNLSANGRTARMDALVVGYFGVLGVKALGYGGSIYGHADEKVWVQKTNDANRREFPNPLQEAATDIRVIRDILFAEKLKTVPVEVVVVLTNDKADLALPKQTGHYTLKEFRALLKKEKYRKDTGLDLEKLKACMEKQK